MENNIFTEINLKSWSEFRDKMFSQCCENPERWIFRGMSNSKWVLKTSLERLPSELPKIDIEDSLISYFKKRVHHYIKIADIPDDTDLIDWMTLMQHYGAPTRLLDWTLSPFIASFFAFESNIQDDQNVSIWAINTEWLNSQNEEIIGEEDYQKTDLLNLHYQKPEKISKGLIYPVFPRKDNERVINQKGRFLIGLNPYLDFMSNFNIYKKGIKNNLLKYNLSRVYTTHALYELDLMNINYSILFPGIEGYAKSMFHFPVSIDMQIRKNY